jgi:squalene-hopene/tetraprenyl-beta-curcumene cyclase
MKNNLEKQFKELSQILVDEMNPDGFWTGELSSSALGVAVSVAALHFHDARAHQSEIQLGLNWLENNINVDGSYGDTPESPGNISTSLLVYAALNLYTHKSESVKTVQEQVARYLQAKHIDIKSENVSRIILAHYQKDYTFSVPILTMCALCGVPGENGFKRIPQLPFELALLPQKFYRLLNLSVVSYAVPALIAVGIVIFKKKKSGFLARWVRERSIKQALKKLQASLPESGGFLEAIPLTAFVSLSLINAGYVSSPVVKKGIDFLKRTQRPDGGWPIDVDLSTWVTTLSIKALGTNLNKVLSQAQQKQLTAHLKSVQNKQVHPFNGTSPGGWGWTNYSGSVPDGDDTPGALLALLRLNAPEAVKTEVINGARWLLKLQNNDGGFPTFSRGWGKLPFDHSCCDLTGHCFLALSTIIHTYKTELSPTFSKKLTKALNQAIVYLEDNQLDNGAWLPLWFGNQNVPDHLNPVYGTARVLTYLNDALPALPNDSFSQKISFLANAAEKFLVSAQNPDGSWGGDKNCPGSIEETALAISAMGNSAHQSACEKGLYWLDQYMAQNGLKAAPIGLYFASLWYDEKMYPLTAYLEAVRRMIEV